MAPRSRAIGHDGLEQGGDNLGNDYSRNITREKQQSYPLNVIVQNKKKKQQQQQKAAQKKTK